MAPRRLDPRVIADLFDTVEYRITKKVKSDFRFEMKLMKNDMVTEIMRFFVGVPQNVGTKDGSEEATEDFEPIGSSGDDQRDKSGEDITALLH